MKKKSLKRTLIISGCYILLLAVLLIGLTLARYQDAMLAYTDFKAAEFNGLILGANTVENMNAGTVNKFGINLVTTGFRPGMTWQNDASNIYKNNPDSIINFSISNGTNDESSSQVPVEYTLRLRTSGNLPLEFTLAAWMPDESPEGGHYELYSAGTRTAVTNDNNERDPGNWYEYTFYPSGSSEEAVFELAGGKLSLNSYRILMKWPVTEESDSSPIYMKEVELVEILATLSSKNMLDEAGYGEAPISTAKPEYSTGVILLEPVPEQTTVNYTYEIDYRSFEAGSGNTRSHTFTIENGIDKHITQRTASINYTALLKIPLDTADDYTYTLNGAAAPLATDEYRLYDERKGTYEVLSNSDYPEGKNTPDYRIYAIYTLADAGELNNAGNDADTYTITIKKADSSEISTEELKRISPDNKLEVLVEAAFTD